MPYDIYAVGDALRTIRNKLGYTQNSMADKANRNAPVYTVIPGTTNLEKNHIPVHFEINPKDIKGYLKCKTMFLPEQIITINKSQVIQTAGIITNTEAIKLIDDMLIRQLQIGEYDGR